MESGLLYWVSQALELYPVPVFALASALAMLASKKKLVLVAAVLAVAVLVPAAKEVYAQQRPCANGDSFTACDGYGFPSQHAAVSAAIAAGLLGTTWFFLALPSAVFIAYTRVFLNMHTFPQVAGGIAFGLLVYFLVDALALALKGARQAPKRPLERQETSRQLFHMFVGVTVVVAGIAWGIARVQEALVLALVGGLLLINAKALGTKLGILERALARYERRSAEFAGKGALFYCVGALFLATFALSAGFALAALSVLAVSDAASTIVGVRLGRKKLPWNPAKSWAGSIAFFSTGAAAAFLFIGWAGVWLAGFLALVETYDFHVDDNLLIPAAAIGFEVVAHAMGAL